MEIIIKLNDNDLNKEKLTDLIGYSKLYIKELKRLKQLQDKEEEKELMDLVNEIFKDPKHTVTDCLDPKKEQFLTTEEIDKIVNEISKDNKYKLKEKEIMDEIVKDIINNFTNK